MTDKQIIIDGVDVSGCINFRPDVDTAEVSYTNACSIGIWQRWYSNLEPSCIMSCSCKYNPDCYYKQLKRKEQKLAKIKQYVEDNEWCILDVTYKELKQIIEGKENE